MLRGELLKARAVPVEFLAAGADHHTVFDFFRHAFASQAHPAGAVAKNGLDVEAVWLEFHTGMVRSLWRSVARLCAGLHALYEPLFASEKPLLCGQIIDSARISR